MNAVKMQTMGMRAQVAERRWPDKRDMVESRMRKELERVGCVAVRFSEPVRVEGWWELEAYGEAPV